MRLPFLAVVGLGLAACQSSTASAQSAPAAAPAKVAPKVTGAEARKLVADGAWLVDVRTPQEYAEVHIEGAKNIPLSELEAALPTLPKDRPIVVHCAVGSRSAVAAKLLVAKGYDVRNLGSLDAWNQ
jgi:rhodanese-related sulfurtransferase